jgi:rod shape-determining protein MreB
VLSSSELRVALEPLVAEIVAAVHDTLEDSPPELAADMTRHGIVLCGGGVLLRGFPERLEAETGMSVRVADNPLTCVATGAGHALEELDRLARPRRRY